MGLQGPIHKSIEWLDRMGMDIIEKVRQQSSFNFLLRDILRQLFRTVQGKASDFHAYLKTYGNTICGRHPIGILLHVSSAIGTSISIHLSCLQHCLRLAQ